MKDTEARLDDIFQAVLNLNEGAAKRLVCIWAERISLLYGALWASPFAMMYQKDLIKVPDLLHEVCAKRMIRHAEELERLEDICETAHFAAMCEANDRENVLLAAQVADGLQESINVFKQTGDRHDLNPVHVLMSLMVLLQNVCTGHAALAERLEADLGYVTGKRPGFFRPLWPSGKPEGWPSEALSMAGSAVGNIDMGLVGKAFRLFLK